jgi:hypothetical protein
MKEPPADALEPSTQLDPLKALIAPINSLYHVPPSLGCTSIFCDVQRLVKIGFMNSRCFLQKLCTMATTATMETSKLQKLQSPKIKNLHKP